MSEQMAFVRVGIDNLTLCFQFSGPTALRLVGSKFQYSRRLGVVAPVVILAGTGGSCGETRCPQLPPPGAIVTSIKGRKGGVSDAVKIFNRSNMLSIFKGYFFAFSALWETPARVAQGRPQTPGHSGGRGDRLCDGRRRGAHPRRRLPSLFVEADFGNQVHRDHPPLSRGRPEYASR